MEKKQIIFAVGVLIAILTLCGIIKNEAPKVVEATAIETPEIQTEIKSNEEVIKEGLEQATTNAPKVVEN